MSKIKFVVIKSLFFKGPAANLLLETLAGNLSAAQLQRLLWSAGARTLLVQRKALVRYVVKQASAEEGRQMLELWQLLAERPLAASRFCALI